ncbi:fimbrillin family protein [Bacteroides sp. 51]|uniref:fimbrillin family protein n=1 Tax=Bacteroides sp. 51 TaxID=2302938 RepID=UPI0013D77403|nr:fimbrillin family protein [Bacteroides sp. 51]NDV80601.1 hypothetical protein [Bacteroides sp. 51]
MIRIKNIYPLFICLLLAACNTDDSIEQPTEKRLVEITEAGVNKEGTRTDFPGAEFTDGDEFTLYEGIPTGTNVKSAPYTYNKTANEWTGTPGLYWDDLSVWESNGTLTTNAKELTAILTNGIDWNPTNPFTVITAPTTEAEFLKSDLLVAYDARVPLQPVNLRFYHVLARLRIEITDNTAESKQPYILGEGTVLSLNALTSSTITFGPTTKTTTTAAVTGSNANVTLMRTDNNSSRTFVYEVILPPQSLREATSTLTISGNANEKEYTYELKNAKIGGSDASSPLLQQGYTTTIKLNIEKTEVKLGTVEVTKWVESSSHGTATPNDYPVIEIGNGEGPGTNPNPGENGDDYAGKTLRLTKDVTLEELKEELGVMPLGSKETPFRGTFDGQGFKITDVNLVSNDDFLGIFGYTDGATIKNLNVEGVGVKNGSENSSTATGGLVGYANNTLITNCHVTYTDIVSAAYDNAGGLVGYAVGGTRIEGCSTNTKVYAQHSYAGGLVGRTLAGTSIKYSFAQKFDADNTDYTVEAGNYYAGGLVGACNNTNIEYCYSWSGAKAIRYVGGFVGRYESTAEITGLLQYCYAAGSKIAGNNAAGMVGYIEIRSGKPDKCYWNSALGVGFIGLYSGGDNSSFTLTATQAAMNNVLNTLNSNGTEWELTRTLYNNYVFPTLLKNKGEAER